MAISWRADDDDRMIIWRRNYISAIDDRIGAWGWIAAAFSSMSNAFCVSPPALAWPKPSRGDMSKSRLE